MAGDDEVYAGLDKRLSVVEAVRAAQAIGDEARSRAIDKSFEVLGGKLDRILDGQSEPAATPAGRAILVELGEHREAIKANSTGIAELRGSWQEVVGVVKALRAIVVVLSVISIGISILSFLQAAPKP